METSASSNPGHKPNEPNPNSSSTSVLQDPNVNIMTNLNSTIENQQTAIKNSSAISGNSSTGPKNTKNMSIKEFFTTRLMKGKSFDAPSGAHSPKDETTNWFDEFKARMIKKAQKSSTISTTVKENVNAVDDNQSEESNDSGDNLSRQSKRGARAKLRTKLNKATSHSAKTKHGTKSEQCDNTNLGVLNESFEDLTGLTTPKDDFDTVSFSRDSSLSFKSPGHHFMSLRSRRLQRISSTDRPDFDTASINTIVGRRDSRYGITVASQTSHMIINKLTVYFYAILKWIITNLLPFNYTLPWKLISAIMFSLVILVIGFASSANPENGIFSFVNGFFCGISIATLCFIIIFLSLIVKILPDSNNNTSHISVNQRATSSQEHQNTSQTKSQHHQQMSSSTSSTTNITGNCTIISNNQMDEKSYDQHESLGGQPEADTTSRASDPTNLDDESYKGWMIEFVGDYEARNRGDVKLKLLYVKFENRVLHLYKVKSNQDIESASFPSNVQSRSYDLKTVRKFSTNLLFPKNVRNLKKWLWSKKYPIKIEFITPSNVNQSSANYNANSSNQMPTTSQFVNDNHAQTDYSASPSKRSSPQEFKTIQLILFTKTCREKEEWFRRFKRIVEEIRLAQVPLTSTLLRQQQFENLLKVTTATTPTTTCSNNQDYNEHHQHLKPNQRQSLIRTRSCELIQADDANYSSSDRESLSSTSVAGCQEMPELCPLNNQANNNQQQQSDTYNSNSGFGLPVEDGGKNDSTLTPANADIYSQAVGDLNFIETRPNLDYREYIERVIGSSSQATNSSDWFNSLTGRIFFDVFSQNYWSYWFKRKIQRKLHRIRLPYFMDTLTLTNIDLGSNAPQFLNVVSHQFDSFGLSIDYDVSYQGGLTMTFETKLNLLKMKPTSSSTDQQQVNSEVSGSASSTNLSPTNSVTATTSASTSANSSNQATPDFDSKQQNPAASSSTCGEQGSFNGDKISMLTNQSDINGDYYNDNFADRLSNQQASTISGPSSGSPMNTTTTATATTTTTSTTSAAASSSTMTSSAIPSTLSQTEPITISTANSMTGSASGIHNIFKSTEDSVISASSVGGGGGTTSDSSGSDSDSTSDSSSDEADIDEISDWEDYGAEKTRQNLVKLVDKIASSRYFQQATENRYIKKKLMDISNCPLILVVKIESLTGVLTFNIPPPQTDRVWYGFRPNPELVLKAMPRMGDREVSLSHVTDWIERKLEEEFRKILVIPNMEDVVLPVLKSDHLLYVAPTK